MNKRLRQILSIGLGLMLGTHRMPAPITVPPEATPQPSIMPNAEPPPAKQATKKAAKEKKEPPKEANQPKARSMAGTWSGKRYLASVDGKISQTALDQLIKFKISADETMATELLIIGGKENVVYMTQCKRKGNTLTWVHIQNDPIYDGKTQAQKEEFKLTLQTNGTAIFDELHTYISDGVTTTEQTMRTMGTYSR